MVTAAGAEAAGASDRCTTVGGASEGATPADDRAASDRARCSTAAPRGGSNRTSRCTAADVPDPGSVVSGTPAAGSCVRPGLPDTASTIPTAEPEGADGPRPCSSSVSIRGVCQVERLPAKSPNPATECTPSASVRWTGGSARHPGSGVAAGARSAAGAVGVETCAASGRDQGSRSQDHRPIPVTSPAVPGRSSC